MTTIIKYLTAAILASLLFSCNFDINMGPGIKGNGNVVTIERELNPEFDEIVISRGVDVYLTQSENESLTVQADENLHDIIMTKVKDNVLEIYADENIGHASSKKILLNFDQVSKIKATSGTDVYSTNTITCDKLYLSTTSGSDMELDINTKTVDCESTSGSDLKLTGSTHTIFAKATSGSDIKAHNLVSQVSNVEATSGADITVMTTERLHASASSGGDIKYYGNPQEVNTKDSASGSIKKH